jgi:hypothetical protein
MEYMYRDASIYLTRKYNNFKRLKEQTDYFESKPKPVCKLCGDKHFAKGYCYHHYNVYEQRNQAAKIAAREHHGKNKAS